MYEIFKNALKGQYELVDMLNKIAEYYIKGNLSKEEKEELEDEARNNANPENSYAPNAYNTGDKITYNGKHYECIFDGCVWNPAEYPQGWKEVE